MTGRYKGKAPFCPECGDSRMILQAEANYTYRNGRPKKFYRCRKYPECRGRHGAHPNGEPLGVPVREEIRRLRKYVHVLAAQIWKWDDDKERAAMYEWLEKNTKSGHIGKMLEPELKDLETKLINLTANLNQND